MYKFIIIIILHFLSVSGGFKTVVLVLLYSYKYRSVLHNRHV